MLFPKRLCVLACLLFSSLSLRAGAYTIPDPPLALKPLSSESIEVASEDIMGRIKRAWPEQTRHIESLSELYTGWLVEFYERYGADGALFAEAMSSVPEGWYFPLLQYPDVFIRLCQEGLSGIDPNARPRLAAKLMFAMTRPVPEEFPQDYLNALTEDVKATRNGRPTAQKMLLLLGDPGKTPSSFWGDLRRQPSAFAQVLRDLSALNETTVEEIVKWPQAVYFLLNVGQSGVGLMEDTGGVILSVAERTPDHQQKYLPAKFRRYSWLASALRACGAEAYEEICEAPELFDGIVKGQISHDNYDERCRLALAVLRAQLKMDRTGTTLQKRLAELRRPEDINHIGYLMGELADRANVNREEEILGSLAVYTDLKLIPLLKRFDSKALDLCARYGAYAPIGALILEGWNGRWDEENANFVFNAVKLYGDYAFEAAVALWGLGDLQKLVRDAPAGWQEKTLMCLGYAEREPELKAQLLKGRKDWQGALHMVRDEYQFDPATGRPMPRKSTSIVPYIPVLNIYQIAVRLYRYHEIPPLSDVILAMASNAAFAAALSQTPNLIAWVKALGTKETAEIAAVSTESVPIISGLSNALQLVSVKNALSYTIRSLVVKYVAPATSNALVWAAKHPVTTVSLLGAGAVYRNRHDIWNPDGTLRDKVKAKFRAIGKQTVDNVVVAAEEIASGVTEGIDEAKQKHPRGWLLVKACVAVVALWLLLRVSFIRNLLYDIGYGIVLVIRSARRTLRERVSKRQN